MRQPLNSTLEKMDDKTFRETVMKEFIEPNDSNIANTVVIAHDYVRFFGTTWSNGLQNSLLCDVTIQIADFNDLVALIQEHPYLKEEHTQKYKKYREYKLHIPIYNKLKKEGYEGEEFDMDSIISFIRRKYNMYICVMPNTNGTYTCQIIENTKFMDGKVDCKTYDSAQYWGLLKIKDYIVKE